MKSNKPLKFVPLRSTGRSLRSRRLAGRYMSRESAVVLNNLDFVLATLYVEYHQRGPLQMNF